MSPLERDHPMAGRIYDVRAQKMVRLEDFLGVAARSDFVFLGEQHDNIDHHALQAQLLRGIVRAGKRPAVAFEQLDLEQQPAIDASLAATANARSKPVERASALAEAVAWSKSGWPPFDIYEPVFEVAIRENLPIRAANLSRRSLHALFAGGMPPASTTDGGHGASRAGRNPDAPPASPSPALAPLSEHARAAMAADIEDSHCGYANPAMVSMMIDAQRRRNAAMAEAAIDALRISTERSDRAHAGVVLVCGFAHARLDSGAPLELAHEMPGSRIVSLAFVELGDDVRSPADYDEAFHASSLPFDYLVFTARTDATDPCEKYRGELEKMKKH